MDKQKPNAQTKSSKEGYLIIPGSFLREGVRKLGVGPALLYLELLTYCHRGKDTVWPSLSTLSYRLGISKNSLLRYRKTLIACGLIKKMVKRRGTGKNHQPNLYQVTPLESAKNELSLVQILGEGSSNMAPGVVQNLHPNNNHKNNIKRTTTSSDVAVVNFEKLKEGGEERVSVLRERMKRLAFKEELTEKIIRAYAAEKIEEKLDLLEKKRNVRNTKNIRIRNPAGWLAAALKDDYREEEEERDEEKPIVGQASRLSQDNQKILSPEEAIKRFRLLRQELKAIND
jgi:hypothetical protein